MHYHLQIITVHRLPFMKTPTTAGGWRRHLHTLGVKLFLAIAGANIVLVVAAYQIYSASRRRWWGFS